MSNRNDEYESFLEEWQELVDKTHDVSIVDVDSESVDPTQEFARLLKVITYIDESIKSIDSELVPSTLWSDCKNQCISSKTSLEEAVSNRTEASVLTANNQIDALLSKLTPYFQDSLIKIKAMKPAFNTYIKYITNQLDTYKNKNDDLVKELQEKLSVSSKINDELLRYKESISKLHDEFLIGTDEKSSLQAKLKGLEESIDEQHSKIDNFYNSLLVNEGSIQSKIEEAQELITAANVEVQKTRNDLSVKLDELDDFHNKVFGEANKEGAIVNPT